MLAIKVLQGALIIEQSGMHGGLVEGRTCSAPSKPLATEQKNFNWRMQ
jgi:hypothetical protein